MDENPINKIKVNVYFVPPDHIINGGVMSIFSICKEARSLSSNDKNSFFYISTYPGTPSYGKNTLFDNNEVVYDFESILKKHNNISSIVLNIPELVITKVSNSLNAHSDYLNNVDEVYINVLNQNIKYMPEVNDFLSLYKYTDKVSQSTAHNRYATQELSDIYGVPLKHLSVYLDPSQYKFIEEKSERLIVYSPDNSEEKQAIISKLKNELTEYEFIEVRGLKYDEYKELLGRARYVITFGEGMDGYFIESSFSGAVPISVYNDDFFPGDDFLSFDSVFANAIEMKNNLVKTIQKMDGNKIAYEQLRDSIFKSTKKYYNFENYRNNLRGLLQHDFDYFPSNESLAKKIHMVAKKSSNKIDELNDFIGAYQGKLDTIRKQYTHLKDEYRTLSEKHEDVIQSKSWKITKPLRSFLFMIKR